MADRNGMVQMKATQFFTVNSPTTAQVLHGDDREEADVAARFPYVSEKDAAFLEEQGLAKPYDGKVPTDNGAGDGSGYTIDERAGVMTEDHNDAEESVERTTGLATRASTVYERPVEELAGAGGAQQAMITATDTTSGPAAEDEAPASGRDGQGTSAKAKSSGKAGSKSE